MKDCCACLDIPASSIHLTIYHRETHCSDSKNSSHDHHFFLRLVKDDMNEMDEILLVRRHNLSLQIFEGIRQKILSRTSDRRS